MDSGRIEEEAEEREEADGEREAFREREEEEEETGPEWNLRFRDFVTFLPWNWIDGIFFPVISLIKICFFQKKEKKIKNKNVMDILRR